MIDRRQGTFGMHLPDLFVEIGYFNHSMNIVLRNKACEKQEADEN